jgi:hypothetical protein
MPTRLNFYREIPDPLRLALMCDPRGLWFELRAIRDQERSGSPNPIISFGFEAEQT